MALCYRKLCEKNKCGFIETTKIFGLSYNLKKMEILPMQQGSAWTALQQSSRFRLEGQY